MARLTLNLGELTLDLADRSPWLSRRRLRAWEEAIHHVLDRVAMDAGQLTTTTELADFDDEVEVLDRPGIGFRGGQP